MRMADGVRERAAPAPRAHPWVGQAVREGSLLAVSGQVPLDADGELMARGVVGVDVDEATARRCARQCAVNLIARAEEALGSLDPVERVLRMTVYVVASQNAVSLPEIAHGASEAMVQALGDRGRHARAAVGVAALPLGAPVEVEALLAVADEGARAPDRRPDVKTTRLREDR